MRQAILLISVFVSCVSSLQSKAMIYPLPAELRSEHFTATVNGRRAPVGHAATTYYFLNFAVDGKARVSIMADTNDYWAKGVEVQPWRWGIRPVVNGRKISFDIDGPVKLSISRPGDHSAGAEMLFLFANARETDVPNKGSAGVHYFGPGVYRENIDAENGQTIYLAPGAVVFGALNVWEVQNVKVQGRGTIVYDGPQDPNRDEGWMHKRNWHGIVMDHASHIEIDGITVIVRSRTWMIQMLGSRDVRFDNVKIIGGCPGNANQDGMDWLGGGDTTIHDSFFRASDDIFALYGNWLGYTTEALTTPGETVDHITIEDSVLSTSISNVVRVSWPQKIFDSRNFTMKNSDVIHMGQGGCKVPFGLLEIWDDPDGKGHHQNYSFENIRLEDWYSLLQLRQQNPDITGVTLRNIWALGNPSLVASVVSGHVNDVALENVSVEGRVAVQDSDVPLSMEAGAVSVTYRAGDGPHSHFTYLPTAVMPKRQITFDASGTAGTIKKYEWRFGDGTSAEGRVVDHKFNDMKGTYVDSSGNFRVLLKVTDVDGRQDWSSQTLVVADSYAPPVSSASTAEVEYKYFEERSLNLADLAHMTPATSGALNTVGVQDRKRDEDYAFTFDGFFDVPVTGGYKFFLLGNDAGELQIDARTIAVSPLPKPQVCGMRGNMVQLAAGSAGLQAGKHSFHIAMNHSTGPDGFAVKWQGPRVPLTNLQPAVATVN